MSYDLQTEVDRVYRMIERKVLFLSTDPFLPCPLTGNCRLLKSYADNIIKWAKEYDHKDLPSINGFHTWVRIVIKFGERVLTECHDQGAFLAFSDPVLIKSSVILLAALELLSRLKIDLSIKSKVVNANIISLTSPYDCSNTEAISLQNQLIDEESQVDAVFQYSLKYDLTGKLEMKVKAHNDWVQNLLKSIGSLWMATFVDPLLYWTSKTQTFKDGIEMVMANTPLMKNLPQLPMSILVTVPSNRFVVDVNNSEIVESKASAKDEICIQVLMSKTRSRKFAIVACLDNDDNYANQHEFSDSTNIVKIKFNSNPKFRSNLQSLLDVYLWLWSQDGISIFGFTPQHVTLMGKGICGTLMLSLSCLMNNDRVANSTSSLPFVHEPDRIIAICSPYLLRVSESPSRLFGFLQVPNKFSERKNNWIGKYLKSLESYLDIKSRERRRIVNEHSSKLLSAMSYAMGVAFSSFNSVYSLLLPANDCRFPTTIEDWNQISDGWLKDVSSRISQVNELSSNGLISPLLHPRISKLHSTSLHLMLDQFDINLDDNFSLAKLWSGPLKIHILNEDSRETPSWLGKSNKECDMSKRLLKVFESGE